MIISNNQIQSLLALYLKQDEKYSAAKREEIGSIFREGSDKLSVSKDARAFSMAKDVIRDLPEIREDRLALIQKRVKTGTYEVTEEEVAAKMIGRSLVDKLV